MLGQENQASNFEWPQPVPAPLNNNGAAFLVQFLQAGITWLVRTAPKQGQEAAPPQVNDQGQSDPNQLNLERAAQASGRFEFKVERMLEGEKSAEEGRVRPLADVLNELRARNRR